MIPAVAEVLLDPKQLQDRIGQLGRQISQDYAGKEPLFVGVLKGAAMFMMDLIRCVELPLAIDFMAVSSYGAATESSGVVRILKDLEGAIDGRDVILVEDIIDTGLTLSYLLAALRAREPSSLEVCTLLDRSARRIPPLDIRYRGFDCPDVFVVGYGLDVGERYRNLPFILALDRERAQGEDPDALVPYLSGSEPVDVQAGPAGAGGD